MSLQKRRKKWHENVKCKLQRRRASLRENAQFPPWDIITNQ